MPSQVTRAQQSDRLQRAVQGHMVTVVCGVAGRVGFSLALGLDVTSNCCAPQKVQGPKRPQGVHATFPSGYDGPVGRGYTLIFDSLGGDFGARGVRGSGPSGLGVTSAPWVWTRHRLYSDASALAV